MPSLYQQSTSLCDTKYKIVFLGDMGVGKTSIIQRFVKDQFDIYNNPTVGIDFLSRNISFQSNLFFYNAGRLQLWDTAGQEKYKSLVPAYLRDANCAVFVFDFTRPETFDHLDNWIQIYRDHCPQTTIGFILGNKHQTLHEQKPANNINKIPSNSNQSNQNTSTSNNSTSISNNFNSDLQLFSQQFSRKQSMNYFKVSAKTGKNILKTFQSIILELQRDLNKENFISKGSEQDEDTKMQKELFEKFNKLKLGSDYKNGKDKYNCCYI